MVPRSVSRERPAGVVGSSVKTMELTEDITARLEGFPEVRFALLFGSAGRGEAGVLSDLDVAVYVDPDTSARERFDLRIALGNELVDLGRPDVVVLNDAPPLLAHRALQGRRLVVRDEVAYVRFFVRTLAMSEDQRPMRELHARARRRRLEEGRFGRP